MKKSLKPTKGPSSYRRILSPRLLDNDLELVLHLYGLKDILVLLSKSDLRCFRARKVPLKLMSIRTIQNSKVKKWKLQAVYLITVFWLVGLFMQIVGTGFERYFLSLIILLGVVCYGILAWQTRST